MNSCLAATLRRFIGKTGDKPENFRVVISKLNERAFNKNVSETEA